MLLIGYLYGIRSETRLCDEVHLNLAYRWFCGLGLEGDVPERSTFSKNRHGRFQQGELSRVLFEEVVRQCVAAGLVEGDGAAVDGSVVDADASRKRRLFRRHPSRGLVGRERTTATRARVSGRARRCLAAGAG